VEKIIHSPYYNRYTDKTQVFSFYQNDDISRRALHVQLVARIARNIGRVLGLNEDLIEAIALGHDIGHTPFGHAGERILNDLYYGHTGRYFNHNVHSVRVLDEIFARNISLQTLDGILCHNGEFEQKEYRPVSYLDFTAYDKRVEECYTDQQAICRLVPYTLEACVVRISDMIAYLGKDRQDAVKAGLLESEDVFKKTEMGETNAEIVNNLTVNIIEKSYNQNYILMDEIYYQDLKNGKKENYAYIYKNEKVDGLYKEVIAPMFEQLYHELLKQLENGDENGIIYKHHIAFVNQQRGYYNQTVPYEETEKNQIVVDYLASMTDDYFLALYAHMFPKSSLKVDFVPYF
jgi:dGTPase